MQVLKQILALTIILLLLYSCSPVKRTSQTSAVTEDASSYIEKYKDIAVSEMKRKGVPASITLAQGMIESDYGRSRLAREANNHFGIKCHDDWTGPTIRHHDDRRNECFRKYSRPQDSFYDHSDFLASGSRYASLFDLPPDDYKGWARGLKKAGYATDPDYADMLIRKIEENNLYYYDAGYTTAAVKKTDKPSLTEAAEDRVENFEEGGVSAGGKDENSLASKQNKPIVSQPVASSPVRIMENNRIQYIIVKEGETREMIEKEFHLLRWELPRYNELEENFIPVAGQLLYLQPKRERAEPGREIHLVAEGDTMYSLSQKYGIKIQKLYDYNRMNRGEEPAPGNRLWLRTFKPVI